MFYFLIINICICFYFILIFLYKHLLIYASVLLYLVYWLNPLLIFTILLNLFAVIGWLRTGRCSRWSISVHFRNCFHLPRIIAGKSHPPKTFSMNIKERARQIYLYKNVIASNTTHISFIVKHIRTNITCITGT